MLTPARDFAVCNFLVKGFDVSGAGHDNRGTLLPGALHAARNE